MHIMSAKTWCEALELTLEEQKAGGARIRLGLWARRNRMSSPGWSTVRQNRHRLGAIDGTWPGHLPPIPYVEEWDPPKNDRSCGGTEGTDSANVRAPFTNKGKKASTRTTFLLRADVAN
ncbi:hypothetical protein ACSQ67_023611 [Phaseolus vulgaris]